MVVKKTLHSKYLWLDLIVISILLTFADDVKHLFIFKIILGSFLGIVQLAFHATPKKISRFFSSSLTVNQLTWCPQTMIIHMVS